MTEQSMVESEQNTEKMNAPKIKYTVEYAEVKIKKVIAEMDLVIEIDGNQQRIKQDFEIKV